MVNKFLDKCRQWLLDNMGNLFGNSSSNHFSIQQLVRSIPNIWKIIWHILVEMPCHKGYCMIRNFRGRMVILMFNYRVVMGLMSKRNKCLWILTSNLLVPQPLLPYWFHQGHRSGSLRRNNQEAGSRNLDKKTLRVKTILLIRTRPRQFLMNILIRILNRSQRMASW